MAGLLRFITLRHLTGEPSRTFLTLLGVALGVSVFLAIRLANQSVVASFHSSMESVTGKATLQIRGESFGFDENVIRIVRKQPGIVHLAPVIETSVGIEEFPGETMVVIGMDPLEEQLIRSYTLNKENDERDLFRILLEPTTLLVTQTFADRHDLKMEDSLTLLLNQKKHSVTIKGILEPLGPAKAEGGLLAFMDISSAQWIFNKLGKLDRIDLVTNPDQPVERVQKILQEVLPKNLRVQRPERRTVQVEGMLKSFQMNLTVTGGIALLVALFLVHNTMTIAVAKRRKEIGLLRSLGCTRKQILTMMTLEGLLLGFLGSILGVILGLILARWTLQAVSTTVSSLYLPIRGETLHLSPSLILEAIGLGTSVSFMAVLSPAIEATRTLPRDTLQSGFFEKKPVFSIGPRTLLGLFLIFISLPLAFWAPWGEYTANGYLSSFFLLLGTLFLVPLMSSLLKNILVKSKKTTSILSLALINLNASLQRTTSATTPLLVALALMVGILLMVHSFRNTVDRWIHDTIRADLIVVSKTWDLQGSDASLPENTVGLLERLPGVMAADGYREIQTYLKDEPINLVARNLDIHNRFSQYLFLEGESSSILLAASQGKGFLLSETLSNRFRLQKGDRIRLDTPQGLLDLPILGVFYDYSTDGGRVLMDRSLYRRYWPQDDQVSVVALYLDPEIPSEIFRKNLITAIDDQSFVTINNRELREGVMEVFDQTFAITYAMELIAVMVGLLGIFNTLLTSILERKRELGILRAIGMSQNQLVKMILTEGGLIGLTGALLGGGAGIGLSLILIQVINKQTFGWTIHFSLFHPFLFVVFGLVLLTAVIASLLPAKKAINIHIAQAVHYE